MIEKMSVEMFETLRLFTFHTKLAHCVLRLKMALGHYCPASFVTLNKLPSFFSVQMDVLKQQCKQMSENTNFVSHISATKLSLFLNESIIAYFFKYLHLCHSSQKMVFQNRVKWHHGINKRTQKFKSNPRIIHLPLQYFFFQHQHQ